MRRTIPVPFALLLALAAFPSHPAEPVRIAVITGLSGINAIYGEGQVNSFRAAADYVNARNTSGGAPRIEIVPFDDNGATQDSLLMLRRAIDDGIRYIASTRSSVVHALSEAIAKHNSREPERTVLLLNFNALDPALTESKCRFWHFRFEPHADTQLAALIHLIAGQPSIHKIYLINQDYAYGQSVAKASREMLGQKRPDIQIVGDDLIPLAKVKDFAPYVAKIRASGADTVLTGNWGSDLSLLIKASKESGLHAAYYTVLGAGFGTASALGTAGTDRVKAVYSWHINAADSAWTQTLQQYQAKYKTNADLAYLPAFRSVEMLSTAIGKAESTDPLRVAHALEGLHIIGPTGDAWIRPEDHQLIGALHVIAFAKVGEPGVKYDIEGSGYAWRTEAVVEAKDNIPPLRCTMERP